MKKIIEYNIVDGHTIEILSAAVNREILNGWQPFKKVSYDGHDYYQAMVKYKNDKDKEQLNG